MPLRVVLASLPVVSGLSGAAAAVVAAAAAEVAAAAAVAAALLGRLGTSENKQKVK